MSRFPDLRLLWGLGAIMLVFCAVGLLGVGAIVGLPLLAGALIMDVPAARAVKWLAYAAPVWAPIGMGMGVVASTSLMRGLRRKPPETEA